MQNAKNIVGSLFKCRDIDFTIVIFCNECCLRRKVSEYRVSSANIVDVRFANS